MRLSGDQVKRFYSIWTPLLMFVNHERRLLLGVHVWDEHNPLEPERVKVLRDALWGDDSLREAFVARNPAGLSDADLDLVRSWQHRVAANFFILKHLKKHSIFHGDGNRFYGVLGLHSPIADLTLYLPFYVHAVLLPFEDRIIYDSLLGVARMTFGGNIRRHFNQEYQDARRRGEVITTMPERESLAGTGLASHALDETHA